MKARKPGTALWTLIFSQLIIGATYLVAKVGLREIPPLALGCLRFLLAAAVFTLLLKQRGKLRLPAREDRRTFFWLALLAVPLNQGLFLYGIQLTLAAHGALFYSTTPIMVLVLSAIWLKERMTPLKIIGTALGFAGVLSILFDDGIRLSGNTLHGDLLLIGAVTTWALYTIISKRLLSRYSALEVTGFSLTLGSLLFLPVGIPAVIAFDHSRVTVTGIGSLLYLALMTSVFGYLVWSWALSKLEASKVAIVSNLQPIVAALLGWIFLGEGITPRFVVGALAVMMGVAITERGKGSERPGGERCGSGSACFILTGPSAIGYHYFSATLEPAASYVKVADSPHIILKRRFESWSKRSYSWQSLCCSWPAAPTASPGWRRRRSPI